jgi:hypothetical protein
MPNSTTPPSKNPAVQSGGAASHRDPPDRRHGSQNKKDAWDKAQILSGFVSSVVIAAVGILINISIQRAQIVASKASADAQIAVTKQNNEAQLALAERTAEIQKHLQEGTLTGQLVEHLTSGSTLKKQLVIVVLRRSIPPEMYQEVITTIVKSDPDPEVRKTALEQARTLRDAPNVVQAIASAAEDANRSLEERKLAKNAVRQMGLVGIAPTNTFVLSSSSERGDSKRESSEFTSYLLRGLKGEASVQKDGNVRFSDLRDFVTAGIGRTAKDPTDVPVSVSPPGADLFVVGPRASYRKIAAVVIGNSSYKVGLPVRFPTTDAQEFAKFWNGQGAKVNLVLDSTRGDVEQALVWASGQTDIDLAIFYYSGYAFNFEGLTYLAHVDFKADSRSSFEKSTISTALIRDVLTKSSARAQVLFLDAGFPPLF